MFHSSAPWRCYAGIQRIFIINLTQRRDRWDFIQAECQRVGLPPLLINRIPAVVGQQVNLQRAYEGSLISKLGYRRLQQPPGDQIWGMDLNTGAVGCALSHLLVWSRIAASTASLASHHLPSGDKPCYLVLEDDSVFFPGCDGLPNFLQRFTSRMRAVPNDWELVYLCGLDTGNQCRHLMVGDGVARVPQLHRTTNGYVVTPSGAQRLLEVCFPLTYQLDTAMTMNVGLPSGSPSSSIPYVLDPISYTLQPPLIRQAEQLGTDIQLKRE